MRRSALRSNRDSTNLEDVISQAGQVAGRAAANAVKREMATPVAAGGKRPDAEPTISQDMLQFLDGIDEIPARLKEIAWAPVTRHNQLTYVAGQGDYSKLQAGIRAQLRPLAWKGELSILDNINLQYYSGVQLRKSLHGGERNKLAPNHTELIREEYTSDNTSLLNQQAGNYAAQGALQKLGLGQRRRSGY